MLENTCSGSGASAGGLKRKQVNITWFNGTQRCAYVTKETLRGFRLASIKDAAIKIIKVKS